MRISIFAYMILFIVSFPCMLFSREQSMPVNNEDLVAEASKSPEEEERIQQMAVQTVAQMAQGIIAIGHNPHDPQVVGQNVANILGSFIGLVAYASKHPEFTKMLANERFRTALCSRVLQDMS